LSDISKLSTSQSTLEFYVSKLRTSCRAYQVMLLSKF